MNSRLRYSGCRPQN